MFRQVPVLPVVVPVAAVVLLFLVWRLRRRQLLSVPRAAVALALCVYAAGVVANTVFPIYLDKPADAAPWKVYVAPFAHYDIADAVTNVVVFAPLGLLVPLLLARPSWWRVLVVSTAVSAMIEGTQLVTEHLLGGGHVADVHDLAFNLVGAQLGFGLYRALVRVPGAADLIDRFRWRGVDPHGPSRGSSRTGIPPTRSSGSR